MAVHPRRARFLRAFRRLLLLAVLGGLLWTGGLFWFAASIPRTPPPPGSAEATRGTDAIVVLTGGSGRLSTGLELLADGRARKLFVSGVYEGLEVQELLKRSRQFPGEMECCITLGYSADSTIGNAYETADWLREQGFTSMRLVTANYHMMRSLLEFRMVIPEVDVVPHPVASPNVHLNDWWLWPGTANLLMTEYNKYIVTRLRYTLEKLIES
ncbi:YdcF family protein [Azospirillum isscasi]|uniref:YdcF family protein n=1 Tax=Azospirillum isscasi TaxID=3053926 RepID=A0ABU0WQJ5_9PROT|nr:YdcF family protein [Azospirillum isscasi]MDQ2106516.1 YdcF family protein [Azospirillum isscasi]